MTVRQSLRIAVHRFNQVLLISMMGTFILTTGCGDSEGKVDAAPQVATSVSSNDDRTIAMSVAFMRGPNEVVTGIHFVLAGDVLFEVDSSDLSAAASGVLEEVLAALSGYHALSLGIEGHTDSDGSEAHNQALSEERASAVQEWFVQRGVAAGAIVASGWGESRPVVPNDSDENKAKNRRVEITLTTTR